MKNLIYTFFLLFSYQAFAIEKNEQSSVFFKAQVDKAIVKPGETLHFKLRLFSPKSGEDFFIPEIGDRIQGFRVIDFGKIGPIVEEDQKVFERWYKLEADLTGSYVLPSITLSYKDGKEKKSVTSSEIFVEVKANPVQKKEEGKKEAQDIRDIKSLKKAPFPIHLVYSLIGGLLALGAILFGAYWWKRKNNKELMIPLIPPHKKALDDLAALKMKTHSISDHLNRKKFYFSISDIVRSYVEESYEFPAKERTQEEIKKEISHLKSLDFEHQKVFLGILREADLVKFADIERDEEQGKGILKNAETFVLETMPKEPNGENEEDSVL
ncbi:MAG: hypothetical protein VYD54_08865 [Bdellovibrionota bacterium]|nr:hypothetical protein [Bdellovibrionota bacterium]